MSVSKRRRRSSSQSSRRVRPCVGLLQADQQGQVWLCEAVIRNRELADYYLVRLSRLQGSEPVGAPVVLSPSEYEAFSRSRGLQDVLL